MYLYRNEKISRTSVLTGFNKMLIFLFFYLYPHWMDLRLISVQEVTKKKVSVTEELTKIDKKSVILRAQFLWGKQQLHPIIYSC